MTYDQFHFSNPMARITLKELQQKLQRKQAKEAAERKREQARQQAAEQQAAVERVERIGELSRIKREARIRTALGR